jgi:hypothetical protein
MFQREGKKLGRESAGIEWTRWIDCCSLGRVRGLHHDKGRYWRYQSVGGVTGRRADGDGSAQAIEKWDEARDRCGEDAGGLVGGGEGKGSTADECKEGTIAQAENPQGQSEGETTGESAGQTMSTQQGRALASVALIPD